MICKTKKWPTNVGRVGNYNLLSIFPIKIITQKNKNKQRSLKK